MVQPFSITRTTVAVSIEEVVLRNCRVLVNTRVVELVVNMCIRELEVLN